MGDLGGTTARTLAENVQSVVAAERMGRALDAAEAARQRGDEAAAAAADQAFRAALAEARGAAVLPEEPALLDSLEAAYAAPIAIAETDRLRTRLLALNERAAAERASQAETAGRDARRLLLLAVVCAVVASLVAGVVLARRITRPLRALTARVAGVGPGHLDVTADESDGGEVGALARAFNEMAGRLTAYEALNLRALVREKRTAESLVASIPNPVVVTQGGDARVRLANAAAEALVGEDARGRPLAEAAPALAAARTAPLGPADTLVELGAQTWRLRRTEVAAPAEPDDADGPPEADRLAVLVLDDVTPFRALDAARRDFLAAVSHELRTPLTSMHMAADLLLRDATGPLGDEQRELVEIVRGDAERMKTLTARLLGLARVEVGGRPHTPVDLARVARDAAAGVHLVAVDRGVEVAVDGTATVAGDVDGLTMAVSNLVANAVRYAASRVAVRVEAEDGGARVAVEDDGPGISPGDVDRVFEPLVQAARGPGGSAGLGLAIVRRVAEAHGGRAWAEPGPGGRFFLHFPDA